MQSVRKPFKIERIDNRYFEETFQESIGISSTFNDDESTANLLLGKHSLNSNKIISTKTLDVVQCCDKETFVIVEDRCIRAIHLLESHDVEIFDQLPLHDTILCCIESKSTHGRICILTDNNMIHFIDVIEIKGSKKLKFTRDIDINLNSIDKNLHLFMATIDNTVYLINKSMNRIYSIDVNKNQLNSVPFQLTMIHQLVDFTSYVSEKGTRNLLLFHIDKLSKILHLEILEIINGDNEATPAELLRKKTFKIDKIENDLLRIKKIDSQCIVVLTFNNVVIISGKQFSVKRWPNGTILKKHLKQSFDLKTFYVDRDKTSFFLQLVDPKLNILSATLKKGESNIKWKFKSDNPFKQQSILAFYLTRDIIYLRDKADKINIIKIEQDKNREHYKFTNKAAFKQITYENVTYKCGFVKSNTGSIVQNFIFGGVNLSNNKPFLEETNTSIQYVIKKIGVISNETGILNKLVINRGTLKILFNNKLYGMDQDKNIVLIKSLDLTESYLSDKGNIIPYHNEHIIYCADVISYNTLHAVHDILLQIHIDGKVTIKSYGEDTNNFHTLYELKHKIKLQKKVRTSAIITETSDIYLLINENEMLYLYLNGMVVATMFIGNRKLNDFFILKPGDDLERGMVALSFSDGNLEFFAMNLNHIYFKIPSITNGGYKLIKTVINSNILVVYQKQCILLINFECFQIAKIGLQFEIQCVVYGGLKDTKHTFMICDKSNELYEIGFKIGMKFKTCTTRLELGINFDIPVIICEIPFSESLIMILTRNREKKYLNVFAYDIIKRCIVSNVFTVTSIEDYKLILTPLSTKDNPRCNIYSKIPQYGFIVTFVRKGKSQYQILQFDKLKMSIKRIFGGNLKVTPYSILIRVIDKSRQLITFLGRDIEIKELIYFQKNSNNMFSVQAKDYKLFERNSQPYIVYGYEEAGLLETINMKSVHENFNTLLMEVQNARYESSDRLNIEFDKYFQNTFIKMASSFIFVDTIDKVKYKSPLLEHDVWFYNLVSSLVKSGDVTKNIIVATVDEDDKLSLYHDRGLQYGKSRLSTSSISFQHYSQVEEVIPIQNDFTRLSSVILTNTCTGMDSQPIFIVLGSGSTKCIITKCHDGCLGKEKKSTSTQTLDFQPKSKSL
ncbi:similar to Naumovozyma castellii NCAS_0C03610 hypothetical protein [Maudiozyma saulgeensis]|uniref:Uncharacterized protein n=1 Tax=Maudiozyma saulgeensis TaxID=1789683 RepID=A0A1X7R6F4_9SACH|nr:similar to Naumovozyma castellii NCAS_0C03610 hypothetical protein [Kazachstania saulgeensis]